MSNDSRSDKTLSAYFDSDEFIKTGKTSRETVMQVAQYVLRFKKTLFGALLFLVMSTLCGLAQPYIIGQTIDRALIVKNHNTLYFFIAALFTIEILRLLTTILQAYFFTKLGQKVMFKLRTDCFNHLQKLSFFELNKMSIGRLVTRITNDVNSLADAFSSGFVTIGANFLSVVGISITIMVLNWKLGLIALSVLPFLIIISSVFSLRLRSAYRNARSRLSALNAYLAENLLGMKVLQLFNRQQLHFFKFQKLNNEYAKAQFGSVRVFALFQPTITLATGLSMALIIYFGGAQVLMQNVSLGELVAIVTYVSSLFQPVREIADKWNVILSSLTSAERIFNTLKWPIEDDIKINKPVQKLNLKGDIEFKNVWFSYIPDRWVLKDVSFKIKAGQSVGIVGATGAGKSTIISLLMKFYSPQRGQIFIDGVDISTFDKQQLRASCGYIQQDVFLFSGSVLDNITLWNDNTDLHKFLNHSIFDKSHFAKSLKSRLSDNLVESGTNLSKGERQILSFLRALSHDPNLWILDEATSSMDTDSEELLQVALQQFSENKTVISIAHRLSTIENCDLILVLSRGELKESGTHEELIAKRGLYHALHQLSDVQEWDKNIHSPSL